MERYAAAAWRLLALALALSSSTCRPGSRHGVRVLVSAASNDEAEYVYVYSATTTTTTTGPDPDPTPVVDADDAIVQVDRYKIGHAALGGGTMKVADDPTTTVGVVHEHDGGDTAANDDDGPTNAAADLVELDKKRVGAAAAAATIVDDVWSWSDAIVKATGREPVADWETYFFRDPFGTEKEEVVPTDSNAISLDRHIKDKPPKIVDLDPRAAAGDSDGGGGGEVGERQWMCPYGAAMEVESYGQERCISHGQAICKNGWQFGIRHHGDTTYLQLWREKDPTANPVFQAFPGATSLCVGEQDPNVAYLKVAYDNCLHYLIGPGTGGHPGKLSRLKLTVDDKEGTHKSKDVAVKFGHGMWKIYADGSYKTNFDNALWYPIPCDSGIGNRLDDGPAQNPTGAPSDNPADRPTKAPVANPTNPPHSNPLPSNPVPTNLPPSNLAPNNPPPSNLPTSTVVEPGYDISLTTPPKDWLWNRDYSACNRRLQEIFEVKEGDNFDSDEEEVGDDIRGQANQNDDDDPLHLRETPTLRGRSKEFRTSERVFDIDSGISLDAVCIPDAIPIERLSAMSMTATQTCPSFRSPPFSGPVTVSQVDGHIVPEAAGLCASRINPNIIWTLNDYSNHHSLYAIDSTDGSVRQYPIANGDNYDYEDIACGPGPITGVSYIYAADIGDNKAWRGMKRYFWSRPLIAIYRVREPHLATLADTELTKWDKLEMEYADGPHNAEAMIVDPVSGRIFIITKSSGTIWMTPRKWGPGNDFMTLKGMGRVRLMPDYLTGIDISPDGKEIVVKYYDTIRYYCMGSRQYDNPDGAWQDILDVLTVDLGSTVPYNEEPAGEAICFGPKFGDGIYTLSESLLHVPADGTQVPLIHHERI